jgi:hypothetical protein
MLVTNFKFNNSSYFLNFQNFISVMSQWHATSIYVTTNIFVTVVWVHMSLVANTSDVAELCKW